MLKFPLVFTPTILKNRSYRSAQVLKHIVILGISKAISVISPLLIVPLTINYVNPIQYGIWMTLSSIISWMSILDLGLGNGFRNNYTDAIAHNDFILARKYVSTVYVSITILIFFVFIILSVINCYLDLSALLKVDCSYELELRKSFFALIAFFCVGMVVNLFTTLLNADQKPGYAALVKSVGDVCSLFAIYLLSKLSEGSLFNLALYYSGVPCITTLLISVFCYTCTKYKDVTPSIRYFDPKLIKSIVNLGFQFFFINISIILIFQLIGLVLSREVGPEAVTQTNISNRYFSIIIVIMSIISTPFWSSFTDAYAKNDIEWMRKSLRKLEQVWLMILFISILLLVISPWFYKIWLGGSVYISFYLSLEMMAFSVIHSLEMLYITLINGVGKIRVQLIVYSIFALLSWPVLLYSCRTLGIYGALLIPTGAYFACAILGKIQLNKILSGTATGIWNK